MSRKQEFEALKQLAEIMNNHDITFNSNAYGLEIYVNNKKVINPLDDYVYDYCNLEEALNNNYDDLLKNDEE